MMTAIQIAHSASLSIGVSILIDKHREIGSLPVPLNYQGMVSASGQLAMIDHRHGVADTPDIIFRQHREPKQFSDGLINLY